MNKIIHRLLFVLLLVISCSWSAEAQKSVARRWNEVLLQGIRQDFARPPVHARNLFHLSVALYDGWAVYDSVASTYLLGKTVGNYTCPFTGVPVPADLRAAREEVMSYAAYRIIVWRFASSPNAFATVTNARNLMTALGYDYNNLAVDYQSGSASALGNYLGQCVLQMGLQDGANEQSNYAIQFYQPVNPPLVMANPGNPTVVDPNRWQPLLLATAIDQNGNPVPSTQKFQSPEWGRVTPFALTTNDRTNYERDGVQYPVYHDPGPLPLLDTVAATAESEEYKWNYLLVMRWSAHHDPEDGVMWDISPASLGNVPWYPQDLASMHDFYDFEEGGDLGTGRTINPRTGQPYTAHIVPRGDYTRVLAQFWADGPNSETPPGHWFTILNYVTDHPDFVRRFHGQGPLLDTLEWDVKAYFTLGGAMHDAAISCWGIKGWYDGTRPVAALRYMADKGQSSDPLLPHYHPAGVPLTPGSVELVTTGDPLAGPNGEHVGKIKFYTWRGPLEVTNPTTQIAGVDWILAEKWWPYQRKTFVTPPFAGYISGHSTYSRASAEVLTMLTGDEYFPGGLGKFPVAANSNFLGLEKGPSVDVTLQYATYRDASDQTSLSRIWGGIHPPFDDIPGRLIGIEIAEAAYDLATTYFYADQDGDGYSSLDDCNDHNVTIYAGAPELCDGLDNNCNGLVDDNIITTTYYLDQDGDGYGNSAVSVDTCLTAVPAGYATNGLDCADQNASFYPGAAELCDGLDNNCNGVADDATVTFTYYADNDGDGYGNNDLTLDTCATAAPVGYVGNALDCNDADAAASPAALEICDGLDNNCNGLIDEEVPVFTYYLDSDGDGFGTSNSVQQNCVDLLPFGYVVNNLDCNDTNPAISPNAVETADSLDNNCNGLIDEPISSTRDLTLQAKVYPNPIRDILTIQFAGEGVFQARLIDAAGRTRRENILRVVQNTATLDYSGISPGLYILRLYDTTTGKALLLKVVKVNP